MEYLELAKPKCHATLFLLLCTVCCSNSFGHPNPLSQVVPLTPKEASIVFERYELIADGEFYALPKYSSDELVALRREDVQVGFRIDKIYKGKAHDSITIQFTNDMLIVPGEEVSRYTKRQRILANLRTELEPNREQRDALKRSYQSGEIDERAYREERDRLVSLAAHLCRKEGLDLPNSHLVVTGRRSFHDIGGAIRPGEKYLIAVNKASGSVDAYFLDEYSLKSTILWGELRNTVLSVLSDPNYQPWNRDTPLSHPR